jgi:hypothetical protein
MGKGKGWSMATQILVLLSRHIIALPNPGLKPRLRKAYVAAR